MPIAVLSLLTLAAVVTACDAPAGSDSDDAPASTTPSNEVPSIPAGDVPAAMLEQVVADAAAAAGVAPSDVVVVSAQAVTWSDGSLGCPAPGQAYTQALVPGYRVVVEVQGEEKSFHAGRDGQFTHCANPQPPADDGTVDR